MISKFDGEYRFLSNFYPIQVKMSGIVFPTVEHAYQAAKTLDIIERRKIAELETPGQAKRHGKIIKCVYNWDNIKLEVMEFLLRQKFSRISILSGELTETHPKHLMEGNAWGDTFWGCVYKEKDGCWYGQNHLGKLLMKIRQELIWSI